MDQFTSPPSPLSIAIERGNKTKEKTCACCGKAPGEYLVVQVGQLWGSPLALSMGPQPGDVVARLCPTCYDRLFRGMMPKNSIQGEFYGYEAG